MNVIRESFKYTKKYMHGWLAVVILGIIFVVAAMLFPLVPQLIIDRIISPMLGGEVQEAKANIFSSLIAGFAADDYFKIFTRLLLIMAVLLAIRYITHYVRWNISHYFGMKAELAFRLATYRKLMDQNSLVMARYTSGDLMSICNSDNVALKDFWSQSFSIFLDHILAIAVAVIFLSQINLKLIILPAAAGVSLCIAMVFYTKTLRKRYNQIREASVDLNSCIQENINGVRIIRSYATENIEINKFDKRNEVYKEGFISQSKTVAKYSMLFSIINQIMSVGSVAIGLMLAVNGEITPGQFLTFSTYAVTIANAMMTIANFMGIIQNSMICGNRIFTFLNTTNTICDPQNPVQMPDKPRLSMSHVSIKLDEKEELKDVSVDIPYGKKLGIMGKTGSGKSVMIKAFTRLFETSIGQTEINGINIKDYRVDDVRRQFGYVIQEVFLFSNTVESNIAYYNHDAPFEQIERVAKIAQADSFIHKLTDGYGTIVGERGLGLSGGQKQRLSIARALLKDAPVIVLDDCTSALDMETERLILEGIKKNYSDRTLIIASHRASSVIACDEILYLEDGRIVERGSHSELMAMNGRYCEVFNSQATAMNEEVANG